MFELNKLKDDLVKSLLKKAKGYSYNEECSEYVFSEDGEKLQKKKITTKIVPPDITALKGALDILSEQQKEIYSLSDEELDKKINELISELKKNDSESCNET